MGVIKSLFEKWACKHEWTIVAKTIYLDRDRILFACKKCGKMKRKWV